MTEPQPSTESILEAVKALGKKVTPLTPTSWAAQCPAHEDRKPSLTITDGGDKCLMHCHGGCSNNDILGVLALQPRDMFNKDTAADDLSWIVPQPRPLPTTETHDEDAYVYQDAKGAIVGRVLRKPGKKFTQQAFNDGQWLPSLNGVKLPLYNLVALLARKDETVYLVEGEKDANTLMVLGHLAITNAGGVNGWRPDMTEHLTGRTVVIIADNDKPGLERAQRLLDDIATVAASVTAYKSDLGKDITDHIHAGGTIDTLTRIDGDEAAIAEARQRRHERLVREEIEKQSARDEARRLLAELNAKERYQLPVHRATLTEELAVTDEELAWIVNELWPEGSNVTLTAQYKAGKTTTINSVLKSLADGDPLFGRWGVNHTGRIAVWNYEVSDRQYRTWLRDKGIVNTDLISVLNMRGIRWPLIHETVTNQTIEWLAANNISTWIIDPLARAFVGCGDENSNQDMGIFLDTLDYIKEQAGVANLLIAAHTGRNAETGNSRARGASRFDDWADIRWVLTKSNGEDAERFFSADGRDVDIAEGRLEYDPDTRQQVIRNGETQSVAKSNKTNQRRKDNIVAFARTQTNGEVWVNSIKKNATFDGHGTKTISIALLDEMVLDGLLLNIGHGKYRLPDALPQTTLMEA